MTGYIHDQESRSQQEGATVRGRAAGVTQEQGWGGALLPPAVAASAWCMPDRDAAVSCQSVRAPLGSFMNGCGRVVEDGKASHESGKPNRHSLFSACIHAAFNSIM
jgi:hypothetical protein